MGCSLIMYQYKQEVFNDYIKVLKNIRDNYNNSEFLDKAFDIKEKLSDRGKISHLYYPGPLETDLSMILSNSYNYEPDIRNLGYIALNGKEENILSHPDAYISFLQTKDLKRIVEYFCKINITSQKGFNNYYFNLPKELRAYLLSDWDLEPPEEIYYFQEIEALIKFYDDCIMNNSWIYFDNGQ